ncbi:MAG: sulfatase-like hydrolase/transferase [Verrucomicrobia bacterium]|nr:sulfatase-like hydrolase/transferase [Verrucomicrobiota bacterium]
MKNTTTIKQTRASLVALLLISLAVLQAAETAKPTGRPNIIFILADDVSARDLSCYGGPVKMPVLDRLAKQGVQFNNAWAAPLCGPTRAILHTGKYPHHQGYYENTVLPRVPFFDDPRHLPLLRMAKTADYATGMFGKMHFGDDAGKYGADFHCVYRYWKGYDGPSHSPTGTRDGMYGVSWYWHPGLILNGGGLPTKPDDFGPDLELWQLLAFVEVNTNRPFIAYWPCNLPHMERTPATGYKSFSYTAVPELDATGNKTGRKRAGSLQSNLGYFDFLIGQLQHRLQQLGLAENTIIFFAADNGTANGDKGSYERDSALRVPFVVSGGPVKPHGLSDSLVDFTDIWPTVADLAGYTGAMNTDGHSFAPYLLGQPFTPRATIQMAMNNARWLRDQDWLLDGHGRFFDLRGATKQAGYKDVSKSSAPEVMAARQRFEQLLKEIPLPDEKDPLTKNAWKKFRATTKGKPVNVFKPDYLK